MKKLQLLAIFGASMGNCSAAVLLSGWDFSYYPTAGIAAQVVTDGSADAVHSSNHTTMGLAGSLYINGQFGSTNFNRAFLGDIRTSQGTSSVNQSYEGNSVVDPDFSASTTDPNAIAFNTNSGTFTFELNAMGFEVSTFSMAVAAGIIAADTINWEVSTTGAFAGEESAHGTTSSIGAAYQLVSLDLGAVSGIDNSIFYVRGIYSGGTIDGSENGYLSLDNVQLNGDAIVVPEPSIMTLFAGGLVGFALLRRRSL